LRTADRIQSRLTPGIVILAVALMAILPGAAGAQPFNVFLGISDPDAGYVEVPHSAALNPAAGFTFEAWVSLSDTGICSSIAGKNYRQAWWIGLCGTTLRSYLKGGASQQNGGEIPAFVWTHVAVTFDGSFRRHYINGELVGSFPDTGPLTTSTSPLRIGSDADYDVQPTGSIDDARLWNVARTLAQIRDDMKGNAAPATGLVARWRFDNDFNDSVGGHDGTAHRSVAFGSLGSGPSCAVAASSTALCLQDRFLVTAKYRTGAPGTAEGTAHVVPVANPGSGLFYFFDVTNWEVMVKAINACGLNSRHWIFSAATTTLYYRLDVFDYPSGTQKIYFNYPGPPAPAVTDTDAFATCF
jgi:hypothetical protein